MIKYSVINNILFIKVLKFTFFEVDFWINRHMHKNRKIVNFKGIYNFPKDQNCPIYNCSY